MNPNVKIVETHADPKKGPSDDLVVACREGWVPSISWLVTKEDNSQAIVVVLWRDRARHPDPPTAREPDPPPGLRLDGGRWPTAAIFFVTLAGILSLATVIALVLSSRA